MRLVTPLVLKDNNKLVNTFGQKTVLNERCFFVLYQRCMKMMFHSEKVWTTCCMYYKADVFNSLGHFPEAS